MSPYLIGFIIYLFLLFMVSPLFADEDEPFIKPSNYGSTGLMEIPTARIMKENTWRFGISQIHPFRYYYVTVSPLEGLEINGRVTEILGVKASPNNPNWKGYGNYKDKAVDIKYQILPEGKYNPAIAIGIMDPHGTRLFSAQYIALSKQIYPFDFTIGMGNGRFGKRPLTSSKDSIKVEMFSDFKQWLRDSQIFWGVEFSPSEKFSLFFEYNPIKYEVQRDPSVGKYFRKPVPSHYNFGLSFKPSKWSEIDLTYQRGNQVGVNFSCNFNIGKPLIPIYDPPYTESEKDKDQPLSERITKALYKLGFSDIVVLFEKEDLYIDAQNDKYYYNPKAIRVLVETLDKILPKEIEHIHITLKQNGIPLFKFETSREDIGLLSSEKITFNEFLYLSKIDTTITTKNEAVGKFKKLFNYGFKPSFESFLNDPSGFFKYRLGISSWFTYHPWSGSSLAIGFATYLLNTISTVNKPLSIPVRTDLVPYKKKRVVLERMMFDQIFKLPYETYGRLALGYLEAQYAGIDAEVARVFWEGRLMLGLSGSVVKKRDPDNLLKFKEDYAKNVYWTAFFNTRLNFPEKDISIELKTGRFLAGDVGTRITVSKFINGVILSAWYSFTNTSIFKDNINRGYHDKGIAVIIPIRLFQGTDSKTSYSFAISPWTRDVAQDIDHFNYLFDFIGRNAKIYIDKDFRMKYTK